MKTILVDAIHAFVIKGEGIYKPMFDLLEQYPNKKIILTGADDNEMDKFGLHKMPYEVFTMKHDPEKSDPLYYKTLLEKFSLTSNDVVYFEHAPEAVKSAESVGIPVYFYDNDKKDLVDLKKFVDSNL